MAPDDVDVAAEPRQGLAVLRSLGVADRDGVQPLYLPPVCEVPRVAAVAGEGDAVLYGPLVPHYPERQVPTVLPQQGLVLDGEQPRSLVRVHLQVVLVQVRTAGHLRRHAPPPS